MEVATVSANLKRLRVASGMSQGALAEEAGLSRVGYRNIETGETAPRVSTLERLAKALSVSMEELLSPVRPLEGVRFRAQKRMTTREDVLARVSMQLDRYSELEQLLDARGEFSFAPVRSEISAVKGSRLHRARRAAEMARGIVDLGSDEVVRDICGLLEDNGVKVLSPRVASEGFFGLSVANEEVGPAVVVNTWDRISVERWIFTAAHELGHLLLHTDAYHVDEFEEDPDEEAEADVFAGYFLMPEEAFESEFQEARGLPLVDCVFKLKRIFKVSYRTVLYRLSTLEEPRRKEIWRDFQIAYKAKTGATLKKTDEPDKLRPSAFYGRPPDKSADEPEKLGAYDFVEDRLHRLVRQAIEGERISLAYGATVLGKSLGEMKALTKAWIR